MNDNRPSMCLSMCSFANNNVQFFDNIFYHLLYNLALTICNANHFRDPRILGSMRIPAIIVCETFTNYDKFLVEKASSGANGGDESTKMCVERSQLVVLSTQIFSSLMNPLTNYIFNFLPRAMRCRWGPLSNGCHEQTIIGAVRRR